MESGGVGAFGRARSRSDDRAKDLDHDPVHELGHDHLHDRDHLIYSEHAHLNGFVFWGLPLCSSMAWTLILSPASARTTPLVAGRTRDSPVFRREPYWPMPFVRQTHPPNEVNNERTKLPFSGD